MKFHQQQYWPLSYQFTNLTRCKINCLWQQQYPKRGFFFLYWHKWKTCLFTLTAGKKKCAIYYILVCPWLALFVIDICDFCYYDELSSYVKCFIGSWRMEWCVCVCVCVRLHYWACIIHILTTIHASTEMPIKTSIWLNICTCTHILYTCIHVHIYTDIH